MEKSSPFFKLTSHNTSIMFEVKIEFSFFSKPHSLNKHRFSLYIISHTHLSKTTLSDITQDLEVVEVNWKKNREKDKMVNRLTKLITLIYLLLPNWLNSRHKIFARTTMFMPESIFKWQKQRQHPLSNNRWTARFFIVLLATETTQQQEPQQRPDTDSGRWKTP